MALGAGVYAYQSIRMLPVAVVVGVAIALIFSLRSLADRRQMMMNLAALVIVSFVIFVPLFHYSIEYPEDFWRRASGRLFGDELTQTTDENGNLVMRVPSLSERIDAFNQNIPVLLDNFRNAMLMYNWKGDVAWINNAPNEPAFDVVHRRLADRRRGGVAGADVPAARCLRLDAAAADLHYDAAVGAVDCLSD